MEKKIIKAKIKKSEHKNIVNKKSITKENRRNRFQEVSNYELLDIANQKSGFPIILSKNIPLEILASFYHRYWIDVNLEDESDSSSYSSI